MATSWLKARLLVLQRHPVVVNSAHWFKIQGLGMFLTAVYLSFPICKMGVQITPSD